MDHFDEVAGAGGTGVDIALLGAGILTVLRQAVGCARHGADARRQGREDRVEPGKGRLVAADHQAIAAIQPPDAPRGADIDVVEVLLSEVGGAPYVLLVELLPPSMMMSPGSAIRVSASMVSSVGGPAGSITQKMRGDARLAATASSEDAAIAPSSAIASMSGVLRSKATTSCPPAHQPARDIGAHPAQTDDR